MVVLGDEAGTGAVVPEGTVVVPEGTVVLLDAVEMKVLPLKSGLIWNLFAVVLL